MKQSGRASLLTILAVLAIVLVVGLLAFSRESVGSVGGRFMEALARGDVATLTKLSYLGDDSEEELRRKWEFTMNKATRHYLFAYRVVAARETGNDTGTVTVQVVRNAASPGGYEERFELPMVKVGNEWKVDVKAISREMYPALPR